jgi:hypothetical protein
MGLPALGAAALLLRSKGAREAIIKYGKKAVDEAKKQLKERDKAVSKGAKEVIQEDPVALKARSKATKEIRDRAFDQMQANKVRSKVEGRAKDRIREADIFAEPKAEVPLKLKKGGKVSSWQDHVKSKYGK